MIMRVTLRSNVESAEVTTCILVLTYHLVGLSGDRSLGKIPYGGGVGLEVVISSHLQVREERVGQNLNDMTVFIYIVYLTSR